MTLLTALTRALLLLAVALGAVQIAPNDVVPIAAPSPLPISAPSLLPIAAPSPSSEPALSPSPEKTIVTTPLDQEYPKPKSGSELAPTPVGRWAWPLRPRPQVARGFVVGPARWSPGHRGVDLLAGAGVSGGFTTADKVSETVEIRSPASGAVRFAGVIAGRPVLSIDHGGGLISSFEPVTSALHRGQLVQRGDVVGQLGGGPSHCTSPSHHPGPRSGTGTGTGSGSGSGTGSGSGSGSATATCLHWGVRKDGHYIDPLLLVPASRGPAVLLPMRPTRR